MLIIELAIPEIPTSTGKASWLRALWSLELPLGPRRGNLNRERRALGGGWSQIPPGQSLFLGGVIMSSVTWAIDLNGFKVCRFFLAVALWLESSNGSLTGKAD